MNTLSLFTILSGHTCGCCICCFSSGEICLIQISVFHTLRCNYNDTKEIDPFHLFTVLNTVCFNTFFLQTCYGHSILMNC